VFSVCTVLFRPLVSHLALLAVRDGGHAECEQRDRMRTMRGEATRWRTRAIVSRIRGYSADVEEKEGAKQAKRTVSHSSSFTRVSFDISSTTTSSSARLLPVFSLSDPLLPPPPSSPPALTPPQAPPTPPSLRLVGAAPPLHLLALLPTHRER
jgi:hypothetical protein